LILVITGPGGVGKGTLVSRVVERDPKLWLSRSWTTRPRRPGEAEDAYVFVDRAAFDAKVAAGGFLEWAEPVPGQLSGTPLPENPPGTDLVLEINVDGARQVRKQFPDAVVILVLAPSVAAQEERMRQRGDAPDRIAERVKLGQDEERVGRAIANEVVINDDLNRAVDEVAGILGRYR
jgi:guanylate kinase